MAKEGITSTMETSNNTVNLEWNIWYKYNITASTCQIHETTIRGTTSVLHYSQTGYLMEQLQFEVQHMFYIIHTLVIIQ